MDFAEWRFEAKKGIESFDDFDIEGNLDAIERRDSLPTIHETFLKMLFPRQVEALLERIPRDIVMRIIDLRNDELFSDDKDLSKNRDGISVERFGGIYKKKAYKYFEIPLLDDVKRINARLTLGFLEEECMRWLDEQKKNIRMFLLKRPVAMGPKKLPPPRNSRQSKSELWKLQRKFKGKDWKEIAGEVSNSSRSLRKHFQYEMQRLLPKRKLKQILRPYIKRSKNERITGSRKYLCDILTSLFLHRPSSSERRMLEKTHIEEIERDPMEYSFLQLFSGEANEILIPKDVMLIVFEFLPKNRQTLDSVGLVNSRFYITVLESWKSSKFYYDNDTTIEVPLHLFMNLFSIKIGYKNNGKVERRFNSSWGWSDSIHENRDLQKDDVRFILEKGVNLRSINFLEVEDFSRFFGKRKKKCRIVKNPSIQSIKLVLQTGWYRKQLVTKEDELAEYEFSCVPNLQRIELEFRGDVRIWKRSGCEAMWKRDRSGFYKMITRMKTVKSLRVVVFKNVNKHIAAKIKIHMGIKKHFECTSEGDVMLKKVTKAIGRRKSSSINMSYDLRFDRM